MDSGIQIVRFLVLTDDQVCCVTEEEDKGTKNQPVIDADIGWVDTESDPEPEAYGDKSKYRQDN